MDKTLRIAIGQINPTVGDLEGNSRKIISYIEDAKKQEADIVVFPELALCGYPPEDLLLKDHFIEDNLKMLDLIRENASGIIAIIGFIDKDKKKNLYNAAAIIQDKKIKGVYRKIELPNYSVFDEKRYFVSGSDNPIFKFGDIVFGITICEDIWKANGLYKTQASSGAKVLINISASPYHVGKRRIRKDMLIDRAKQTKAFLCYANLVGGQDELVFDGSSFIFNPEGNIAASGKQFEEELIVADLKINLSAQSRKKISKNRNIKVIELSADEELLKKQKIQKHILPKLTYLDEVYKALVLGTKDYIEKNGFKKAIIGLSGGIDSAFVAAIAVDAIGKENVIGVTMPTRYSSKETQRDAQILASNLGMKFIKIPIDSIFNMYLLALEHEFAGSSRDITEENLQARIRGSMIMALSNKFNWLVLTTGNKSEISVGYCTLYGDTAGGFAVIKDVPKTLVYKLAKFRNEKSAHKPIPKSIFTRAPSAELRPNQKDEDSLPPYDVLDSILKDFVEEDKSYKEIISKRNVNSDIAKKIIHMVERNEYKRRQMPPGIKITPKAFGKDRRLPITNKYIYGIQ